MIVVFGVVSCTNGGNKKSAASGPSSHIGAVSEVAVAPYTEISMKAQAQRVPILMYHDLVKEDKTVYFDVTRREFADQMQWISDQKITPITLDQLYRHLTTGAAVPEKSIVITFDDNYQGFHDFALPILEAFKFPAAMFVHTKYVGDKSGKHPKMDWPTLKELVKNPLITIGSHTVTHPADITLLSPEDQTKELKDSKEVLEKQLGKPMDYLAYPDGKNDKIVQAKASECGYKMAFTMENTPAEESPSIMAVGRYIQSRLEKAWDDRETSLRGGALAIFRTPIKDAPVVFEEGQFRKTKLALVLGGMPETELSPSREGVLDFIHRTPGTVAGINGGFFAMAAIASTDNQMVGPCKTHDVATFYPDKFPEIWHKLRNRPLVVWGPTEFAIVAFQPETANTDAAFKDFMPDYTDTFLAGVWLIHNGIPQSKEDMDTFGSKDIQDPRRRAFLGIDRDGHIVLGASTESASSQMLAEAAASAGVQEAVLLDSGFSTSLVYGEDVKASGHSTNAIPSRPVPHAIVLRGTLDARTAALGVSTFKPTPDEPEPKSRHRHRKRKEPADESPNEATAAPPDSTSSTTDQPPTIPPTVPTTTPPATTGGDPPVKKKDVSNYLHRMQPALSTGLLGGNLKSISGFISN